MLNHFPLELSVRCYSILGAQVAGLLGTALTWILLDLYTTSNGLNFVFSSIEHEQQYQRVLRLVKVKVERSPLPTLSTDRTVF